MKKTMESIWDCLQIAGFVLFFWGMGGAFGFFLLYGEPRGIMDCVIGTALLLDLAAMLVCFLWGIFSRRRANRENEEPEAADESAANVPVKHHVSYFGFLIAAALLLMFLGSCFGKEKSPEYRYKIMKSYENGMKAYGEQDIRPRWNPSRSPRKEATRKRNTSSANDITTDLKSATPCWKQCVFFFFTGPYRSFLSPGQGKPYIKKPQIW